MKKLFLLLCIGVLTFSVNAQITTPQPSPTSKLEQKVGLTDVTIEYSRPSMKGRAIFGDLVPFDAMWRFGANKNTTITFRDDVSVGGQDLKAGSYAIFAKPSSESWEIYFYSDTENWGTPGKWDDSKVAAKVTAKVSPLAFDVQTFTLDINNLTNSGATLDIIWEKSYLGVPFTVPTDKAVQASIDKTMNGPGAGDFYSAAVYYLQEGKDIAKAQKWIDKAVELTKDQPRFWYLRQQSLIHAKAGNVKGAIEAAKKSLAGAEAAGNADYVKMNKESLAKWSKM